MDDWRELRAGPFHFTAHPPTTAPSDPHAPRLPLDFTIHWEEGEPGLLTVRDCHRLAGYFRRLADDMEGR